MIAIIDYDAGNLASVSNALSFLELPHLITNQPSEIFNASAVLFPGVGAFADAMKKLEERNLVGVLKEVAKQKPFLGICLGLQLLFETGEEYGETQGLGLIEGRVRLLETQGLKLPHIGWNNADIISDCVLTEGVAKSAYYYYVHSFYADTKIENVVMQTQYGQNFPGMVKSGQTIFGCQFHPEKSGDAGLRILKNFGRLAHDYTTSN